MKHLIMTLVLASSVFAQAAQLEAVVSCNCSQWKQGRKGDMVLVPAHVGGLQIPKLTEQFSHRLLTEDFAQDENTQQGFFSITPSFAKLLINGSSIFAEGDNATAYITQQCKLIAQDEGYTNCAVSITFPINERALQSAQSLK